MDTTVRSVAGASDFVSLGQRMRSLLALRAGFATITMVVGLAWSDRLVPGLRPGPVAASALYLVVQGAAELRRRRGSGRHLAVVAVGVLVDGAYLSWISFATGGALSPLQALLYVHVIAISLLASYRTGLKVAIWDSLLLLTFSHAAATGFVPVPRPLLMSSDTASATAPGQLVAVTLLALWAVAVATATMSAMNERALRRKRADLEALARMASEMGEHGTSQDIPRILVESLRRTFDVERCVVLASPQGDFDVLAAHGAESAEPAAHRSDAAVERALDSRSAQLIRSLDPHEDPRLTALMPHARNVIVVPLFLAGGFRLGVVVAERAGRGDRIHGWTVTMIQEFASHAAIALHNAWLLEDNRTKLAEIRGLRDELVAQNLSLEARVIARTEELRENLSRLQASYAERQRLLSHLVHAQEDERQRIAGDLHDDPLQLLVGVAMQLDLFRRKLAEPSQASHAAELREMVRAVIEKLRTLMFELRPPILEEEGLAAALRAQVERWRLDQDVSIRINDRFEREPPDEPRLILYRIAQEALANVRKHAAAGTVVIDLCERGGSYVVSIADDGVGFDPGQVAGTKEGHLGLTSMRERAELAGGGCRIHSLAEGGTTVELWLPATLGTASPAVVA